MTRKYILVLVCICLPLVPGRVLACADHLYFDPDNLGFFGGAVVRMAGLAPPEPVFDLEHPEMVKAVIGENNELTVNYSRPFFSKDVRMEISGTKNVLLSQDIFMLEKREGAVSIPYKVVDSGFDTITLTVSGQHKGETVRQVARIYVSGRRESPEEEVQVSER